MNSRNRIAEDLAIKLQVRFLKPTHFDRYVMLETIDFSILLVFPMHCKKNSSETVAKMANHFTPCGIGSVTHTSCNRPLPVPRRFGQYRYRWFGKTKKVVGLCQKFVHAMYLYSVCTYFL